MPWFGGFCESTVGVLACEFAGRLAPPNAHSQNPWDVAFRISSRPCAGSFLLHAKMFQNEIEIFAGFGGLALVMQYTLQSRCLHFLFE